MSTETYTPWDSAELLTDDEMIIEYLKAALEGKRSSFLHEGCWQCRAGEGNDFHRPGSPIGTPESVQGVVWRT